MIQLTVRLIAFDLDDTALRPDASLAPETAAALERCGRAGILLVPASGRALSSLPQELLGICGVSYTISSNGAAVTRLKDGERIFERKLSTEAVVSVLGAFPDMLPECFIDGTPYSDERYVADPLSYGCSPAYVGYVQSTRTPVRDIRGFILENADRLDGLDLLCPDLETRERCLLSAKTLSGVYVTSSSPRLVEFAAPDAGKGAALRALCERLDISPAGTVAFGNGDNDADMLRFAGLGIAVKNASPKCLSAADRICGGNFENGVAGALEELL